MSEPQPEVTHITLPIAVINAAVEVLMELPAKTVMGLLNEMRDTGVPVFAESDPATEEQN